MRILQVVHGWFPRNRGGTERYVAALARGLIEDGHEVAILAGSERGSERGLLEREVWEGMPLYRLRRSGLYLESWYHSYHPDAAALFAELLDGLKPDVVHVHHWHRLTRNIVELCTEAGIPTVVTLHDTSSTCPRSHRLRQQSFCTRSVSPESCGDCVERFFFQSDAEMDQGLLSFREDFNQELLLANRLLAPSPSLAKVVVRQFPSVDQNIRVLIHGALPDSGRPGGKTQSPPRQSPRKSGSLQLAYWGELSQAKGIPLLITALERLGELADLDLDLWGGIAGAGAGDAANEQAASDLEPWQQRSQALAERGGARIEWRGSFEPSVISDRYDLAVFPSVVSESHSFTVDEAFARGIPILVPDRGGPADRMGGAGVTFRAEDEKDLARTILRILDNPQSLRDCRSAVVPPKTMDAHRSEINAEYRAAAKEGARQHLLDPRLARARAQFQLRRQTARDLELYEQRGHGSEKQNTIVELNREIKVRDQEIEKRESAIENREAKIAERDHTIAHKDGVLDDFNQELKQLSEALEQRDRAAGRRVADQEERVREVEALLADRDAAIQGRDQELTSFSNSVKDLERTLEERRKSLEAASANQSELGKQSSEFEFQIRDRDQQIQEWQSLAQSREEGLAKNEDDLRALQDSSEQTRRELAELSELKLSESAAVSERMLELEKDVAGLQVEILESRESETRAGEKSQKLERVRDNLETSLDSKTERLQEMEARLQAMVQDTEQLRVQMSSLDGEVAEKLGPIAQEFIGRDPGAMQETAPQYLDWAVGNHARLHELLGERDALINALAREVESVELQRRAANKSSQNKSGRRERLGQKLTAWKRKLKPSSQKDRTKLLVVVHDFLPKHAAGTEIYTYKLLKELRETHDVHLMFCEARHELPQYTVSQGEFEGMPYTEVVQNYHWDSFEETFHNPQMEKIFESVLDAVDPDIIHIQHLHNFSLNFIPIAKSRGLSIVYTLHEFMLLCARGGQLLREDMEICEQPVPEKCADCIRHQPLTGNYGADNRRQRLEIAAKKLPDTLKEAFARFTGPLASAELDDEGRRIYAEAARQRLEFIKERLQQVDLFISPSGFLRQKFIDSGMIAAEKIIHSANGFDLTPFEGVERTVSETLRFGFVGTIADYKGVHLMIEAFAEIPDQGVELQIWGDIETFQEYKQRLLAIPRPANVQLMGRFENTRIAEVLSEIDVLIVPSVWFENSPLTIHEAWMAGIPVIASDIGGMAELVDHEVNGLHFKVGDAHDLARQCRRLIADPGLIESFKQHLGYVKPIAENAVEIAGYYRALLQGGVIKK